MSNKFKYQRRLSSRLAIVMFRGTPCRLTRSLECQKKKSYICWDPPLLVIKLSLFQSNVPLQQDFNKPLDFIWVRDILSTESTKWLWPKKAIKCTHVHFGREEEEHNFSLDLVWRQKLPILHVVTKTGFETYEYCTVSFSF